LRVNVGMSALVDKVKDGLVFLKLPYRLISLQWDNSADLATFAKASTLRYVGNAINEFCRNTVQVGLLVRTLGDPVYSSWIGLLHILPLRFIWAVNPKLPEPRKDVHG
jgi:hypothetical protein